MRKILCRLLFLLPVLCPALLPAQGQKTDSLLLALQNSKDDTNKVNTLNAIAKEFRGNDPDTAVYFAGRALELSTRLDFKRGIAEAWLWQAAAYANLGRNEDAMKLLLKVTALNGDKKITSAAYNSIGNIYEDYGNYPEALNNYMVSLRIRKESNDKSGVGICYNNIGILYTDQGNYPDALKNYFMALKIQEEVGNVPSAANAYSNIADVYRLEQNYPEALTNNFMALKLRLEKGDKKGIATSYNNIGTVYHSEGKYADAQQYYLMALQIREKIGDKRGMAFTHNNLGALYMVQGNYPAAMEHYAASLKLKEQINDKYGIASCYLNMGNLELFRKNLREAVQQLEHTIRIAKMIKGKELLKDANFALVRADSALGNFDDALRHFKLYVAYRDSLVNEENTKKIVQQQMQYQFDKKEGQTKAEQEKKDAVAASEVRRQKIILLSVAGCLLLVASFSVFIFRSYRQKQRANEEISMQKAIIEEKQKEILDSIHYAKRIQTSLLPTERYILKSLEQRNSLSSK